MWLKLLFLTKILAFMRFCSWISPIEFLDVSIIAFLCTTMFSTRERERESEREREREPERLKSTTQQAFKFQLYQLHYGF